MAVAILYGLGESKVVDPFSLFRGHNVLSFPLKIHKLVYKRVGLDKFRLPSDDLPIVTSEAPSGTAFRVDIR